MKVNYRTGLLFAAVFLLVLLAKVQGQTFQKVYPSPVPQSCRDAIETSDGGFILVGVTATQILGDSDIFILKTNNLGDTLWTKKYGGTKPDYCYNIINSGDGNYFITGFNSSNPSGTYHSWLLKINNSGDTLWTKQYPSAGNDCAKEIVPTSDGNFVIVGRAYRDIYLMKVDPSGNSLWLKTYGGSQYETGRSVKQCLDGGFILTGLTFSYGVGAGDIWLLKTDANGDTTWTKTFGGTGIDDGNGIIANADGTYTLCGETTSPGISNGDFDVQVMKTDANGNVIWNKIYGGTDKDVSHEIQPTSDGGYIVGCISRSFGWSNPDMWLLKLDAVGDTMWARHYGGFDHEHCYSLKETSDGGYIAAGHTKSFHGYPEIMFLKLNGIGQPGSVSISEFASAGRFNVYPNPSEGIVKLEWAQEWQNSSLRITDAFGKTVYAEDFKTLPAENEKTIDLESMQAGVYFITLQSGNTVSTKRIVLQ